jgi:hypothetical protein
MRKRRILGRGDEGLEKGERGVSGWVVTLVGTMVEWKGKRTRLHGVSATGEC